jgi:hypothetical protein
MVNAKAQGTADTLWRQAFSSAQEERVTSDFGTALLHMHTRRQWGADDEIMSLHFAVFPLDDRIGSRR